MLQEMPFEHNDDNIKSSITSNGINFMISLNHDAAVSLKNALYGLAYQYPYYEEVDVWTKGFVTPPNRDYIGLCEITLIKNEDVEMYSVKGLTRYDQRVDRLDVYATKDEVQSAHEVLLLLIEKGSAKAHPEVTLLRNIFVRMDDLENS